VRAPILQRLFHQPKRLESSQYVSSLKIARRFCSAMRSSKSMMRKFQRTRSCFACYSMTRILSSVFAFEHDVAQLSGEIASRGVRGKPCSRVEGGAHYGYGETKCFAARFWITDLGSMRFSQRCATCSASWRKHSVLDSTSDVSGPGRTDRGCR
jgi:hypothetical protein